jgi:hypothetical protein
MVPIRVPMSVLAGLEAANSASCGSIDTNYDELWTAVFVPADALRCLHNYPALGSYSWL